MVGYAFIGEFHRSVETLIDSLLLKKGVKVQKWEIPGGGIAYRLDDAEFERVAGSSNMYCPGIDIADETPLVFTPCNPIHFEYLTGKREAEAVWTHLDSKPSRG